MGKFDEVLAEMRRERERLAADLARVDRVIAALEEGGAVRRKGSGDRAAGRRATKLGARRWTIFTARHLRGDGALPFNSRYAEELDRDCRRTSGRRLQDTFEELREHRSRDVAQQRRQIDRDFDNERRKTLVPQAKSRETEAAEGLHRQ
jgi:hypothetical protein